MALDVRRNRVFTPAPSGERLGKEFQATARRGKATLDFTIHPYADKATAFFIAVRTRNWHDIRRRRFGCAREDAAKMIFANVFEFFSGDCLFMNCADSFGDLERTVTSHKFKWL